MPEKPYKSTTRSERFLVALPILYEYERFISSGGRPSIENLVHTVSPSSSTNSQFHHPSSHRQLYTRSCHRQTTASHTNRFSKLLSKQATCGAGFVYTLWTGQSARRAPHIPRNPERCHDLPEFHVGFGTLLIPSCQPEPSAVKRPISFTIYPSSHT